MKLSLSPSLGLHFSKEIQQIVSPENQNCSSTMTRRATQLSSRDCSCLKPLFFCCPLSRSLSLSRSFLCFWNSTNYTNTDTPQVKNKSRYRKSSIVVMEGLGGDDDDGDDGEDSERPKKVQIDCKLISWNQSIQQQQQQEQQQQIHTNHPLLLIPPSQRLLESRKRPTTITITTIVTTTINNNNNNKKRVSRPKLRKSDQMSTKVVGLVGPKKP